MSFHIMLINLLAEYYLFYQPNMLSVDYIKAQSRSEPTAQQSLRASDPKRKASSTNITKGTS